MVFNPFYQTKAWKQLRKRKIRQNPYCEICEHSQIIVRGEEVDHINPISKGGEELNIDNLQTLCKRCHSQKTYRENKGHLFDKTYDTKINLVCGPPLSGKTKYIKDHMVSGDLVLDIDELTSAISNSDLYIRTDAIHAVALSACTLILDSCLGKVPRVWITSSAPTLGERQQALGQHRATNTIVLKASKNVCLARLLDDDRRKPKDAWKAMIVRWFSEQDLYET